jgi:phosphohistidine phosphatase
VETRLVKRLWLLRHAKSSRDDPGLPDHDRPLALRGRKAAKHVGRWASENGLRPELVLCSTARRTRETLDLLLDELGAPHVELDDSVYGASAFELLERLRIVPSSVEALLIVGHNPGLQELCGVLAPPEPPAFPTGALAQLLLEVDDWRQVGPACAELVGLVVPRSLRP